MAKHHGMAELKGLDAYCKRGHEHTRDDRFGRMFPQLAPAFISAEVLRDIGRKGGPMDGKSAAKRSDAVPVGHVFFGQFVDHDITLDISSSLERVNDPGTTSNVRTPTLDLDCIYGAGPESHAYLYQKTSVFSGAKLLTGADMPSTGNPEQDALRAHDLLRAPTGIAIIGDHRNDENRVVSQLQLGMIRFHNLICDLLHANGAGPSGAELYEKAHEEAIWHYQWCVVNDFLVTMCGGAVVGDILACGRRFYCPVEAHIPIEFAVAAYRFGHSMVPMKVRIQKEGPEHELFGPVLGEGFAPVTDPASIVDWSTLLFHPGDKDVQRAEKLDTTMAGDLLELPFVTSGEASLATRNLLRGNSFLLPGGDKVAEAMGRPAGEIEDVVKAVDKLSNGAITEGVPLWLYILAEAQEIGRETRPGKFDKGEGLGPVGARIVAEVIIGLLELDEHSYLGANRNWVPRADHDRIGKVLTAASPAIV